MTLSCSNGQSILLRIGRCNPLRVCGLLLLFFNIDLVTILFDSSLETEIYNQVSLSPISKYNGADALVHY
jgi:hypothetical protein